MSNTIDKICTQQAIIQDDADGCCSKYVLNFNFFDGRMVTLGDNPTLPGDHPTPPGDNPTPPGDNPTPPPGDGDPDPGFTRATDYFLSKTDADGTFNSFASVTVDNEKNIIAAGQGYSGNQKIVIYKFDKLGAIITKNKLEIADHKVNTSVDFCEIQYHNNGFYLVASSLQGLLLARLDNNLKLVSYNCSDNTSLYTAFDMQVDSNGDIIIAGHYKHSNYNTPALLTFDKDLKFKDRKNLKGYPTGQFNAIIKDSNGNWVVTGYAKNPDNANKDESFILKMDSNFSVLKSNRIYSDTQHIKAHALLEDSHGRYVINASLYTDSDHALLFFNKDMTLNDRKTIGADTASLTLTKAGNIITNTSSNFFRLDRNGDYENHLYVNHTQKQVIRDGLGRILSAGKQSSKATIVALPEDIIISEESISDCSPP
ncbi:MAG: hypothetical protein OIF57_18255 [Marinobacterium sp.]|nr:hypothetical protein [Marinobacterium sp.]